MAQLVDPSFLQAYGDIYKQRNQAIQGFGQSLLGGAAQVGAAAIGRKKDAQALQADIEAQRRALEGEAATLSEQAFQIAPTSEAGPYEQAEARSRLADIGVRQKDIQNQLDQLGAIGDVTWRNVYDKRLPTMPKREATGYSGRAKDIETAQAQALADQKARQAEAERLRREEKDIRDYTQRERLGQQKAGERVGSAVAIEQAKKEIAKQEQQEKAQQAHSKVTSTLAEMQKLIDQYGDTLFGSETAMGKARDIGGAALGTEAQAARELFDNLETELTEMAVEARKGTGTISDSDLAVIQRGGVGRKASSAEAARKIIDRILTKSAQKAGVNVPQAPGAPAKGPVTLQPGEREQ